MVLALGGAASVAAGALWGWHPAISAFLLALAIGVGWLSLREKWAFAASIVALAALAWYGYQHSLPASSSGLVFDEPRRYLARVAEDPALTRSGLRVTVDVEGVAPQEPVPGWNPAGGRVLLTVEGEVDPPPAVGDVAVFRASLREPTGFRNPGSLAQEIAAARRGVAARGFAKAGSTALFAKPAPGEAPLAEFRSRISAALAASAPGQGGATVRAMTLGDRSGLTPATNELFRRSGTIHLLSVSGFHLAIVLFLFAFIFRAALSRVTTLALSRPVAPLAYLAALLPVAAYAVFCGLSAATARALAMTALISAALSFSRRVSFSQALSATLLILLLVNPLSVTDPGLQLSFAAVAGLFWLPPLFRREKAEGARPLIPPSRWQILGRKFIAEVKGIVVACACATLATAPLANFHFGTGGWGGMVHNVVAVPVSGFITLPLSLLGTCLYPFSATLAAAFWQLAAWSADALLWSMEAFPMPDFSLVASAFSSIWGLSGVYLALAALAWRSGGARKRAALALVALAIAFAPNAYAAIVESGEADGRLYAFDVGSGQALAVKLPGPRWMAVDGGGIPSTDFDTGAQVVWPALAALGCGRLDVVVSSHPHPDHALGLPSLIWLGSPREVWLPEAFRNDARYEEVLAAASEVGAGVRWFGGEVQKVEVGGAVVRVLGGAGKRENDRSLALEVEVGTRRALILDDIEADEQARIVDSAGFFRDVDVLVAAHHGAANAVSRKLWEVARPSVALVSCGRRKNLPSKALLEMAANAGAQVRSTSSSGAVFAIFGPGGVVSGAAAR